MEEGGWRSGSWLSCSDTGTYSSIPYLCLDSANNSMSDGTVAQSMDRFT